jgi:hypothetical protein
MKSRINMQQILPSLSLSLLALTLAACQGGTGSSFEDTGGSATIAGNSQPTPTPVSDVPPPEDPTDLLSAKFVPNIYTGKAAPGVKNFEQIFQTMRGLTGLANVAVTVAPLSTVYTGSSNSYLNLKAGLPSSNAVGSFVPSQMLNTLSLATTFCTQVLNNSGALTYRAGILAGTGILDANNNYVSGTPDAFFKATNANGLKNNVVIASTLATKFWGSTDDADADRVASEAQLAQLILDLSISASPQPTIASVMVGACAAALSSGQVVLF